MNDYTHQLITLWVAGLAAAIWAACVIHLYEEDDAGSLDGCAGVENPHETGDPVQIVAAATDGEAS